jgi:hypothetical protein
MKQQITLSFWALLILHFTDTTLFLLLPECRLVPNYSLSEFEPECLWLLLDYSEIPEIAHYVIFIWYESGADLAMNVQMSAQWDVSQPPT